MRLGLVKINYDPIDILLKFYKIVSLNVDTLLLTRFSCYEVRRHNLPQIFS